MRRLFGLYRKRNQYLPPGSNPDHLTPTSLLELEVLASEISRTAGQIREAVARLRSSQNLPDTSHTQDGGQR